jgi:hypothetical protein
MSTRKKYDARRVGFELDSQGRERSLGRDGEWADSIRHEARFAYLNILSREYHAYLLRCVTFHGPKISTGKTVLV